MLSDAGSTPAASTIRLAVRLCARLAHGKPSVRFSTRHVGSVPTIQQPNRCIQCGRTEMHVSLGRLQVLVSSQLLNRPDRRPLIARCEQKVCLRMCTPGVTFARRATPRMSTCTDFCVSDSLRLHNTRGLRRCLASFNASVSRAVSGT